METESHRVDLREGGDGDAGDAQTFQIHHQAVVLDLPGPRNEGQKEGNESFEAREIAQAAARPCIGPCIPCKR